MFEVFRQNLTGQHSFSTSPDTRNTRRGGFLDQRRRFFKEEKVVSTLDVRTRLLRVGEVVHSVERARMDRRFGLSRNLYA